ncbi:MAG: CtsR family transcriptional regulator [Clostridia bacterium]|nr:CtsR family transcriptional regulator [Clostridia bacterium]
MKISDLIEEIIKEMLDNEDGVASFRRNELAYRLNCVPSQINYVINSRFTNDHGYTVESKRGGGGNITITRIKLDNDGYLMHIASSIGNSITQNVAYTFIKNFLDYGAVTNKEAQLIASAISDNVLRIVEQPGRDILRASIFKNMIVSIIS